MTPTHEIASIGSVLAPLLDGRIASAQDALALLGRTVSVKGPGGSRRVGTSTGERHQVTRKMALARALAGITTGQQVDVAETTRRLFGLGLDVDVSISEARQHYVERATLLHQAVRAANAALVEVLLAAGANPYLLLTCTISGSDRGVYAPRTAIELAMEGVEGVLVERTDAEYVLALLRSGAARRHVETVLGDVPGQRQFTRTAGPASGVRSYGG